MNANITSFKMAKAMFAAIAAAMALPLRGDQLAALGQIGDYRSRGKGRGSPSRRYGNPPGKYAPHQGQQERLRRQMRGFTRPLRWANDTLADLGYDPLYFCDAPGRPTKRQLIDHCLGPA